MVTLSSIVLLTLLLKSCKKVDNSTKTADDVKAKALQAIRSKYGNISAGFVYPVHKDATELFYKSSTGKMVSLYNDKNNPKTNGVQSCLFTCNNTSNPANLRIVYTLDYVQRFYKCESSSNPGDKKSMVTLSWTVSVPFAITFMTNDNAPNTWGTLKLTPSGGSPTTYTDYAAYSDLSIVYLGPAPGCATNSLYQVKYSFDDVPNSLMLSGATVEANISLDNDCAIVGYVVAAGLYSAPAITDELNLPCERIDKAWVNLGTGPGGCATATGNYAICSYPSGMTPIDSHQIEYRLVTNIYSNDWDAQTSSTVYWAEPTGTGTPDPSLATGGVSNLVHITSSSGTWLVRYRNVKTSVCDIFDPLPGGSPGAIWGNSALWFTEIWPT